MKKRSTGSKIPTCLAALWLAGAVSVAACNKKKDEALGPETSSEPLSMVEKELQRAHHLLGPERVRMELKETEPIKPPGDIGALAGFGLSAGDPDVTASVYVFESWGGGKDAVEKLKAQVPDEGMHVLHAINGRLLFFGYTRIDGPDGTEAKFRLSGLVSAFAGDE